MPRIVVAIFLGFFFFFPFMFIGEISASYLGDAGFVITFVLMVAYFFVCQFRLWRATPAPHARPGPSCWR